MSMPGKLLFFATFVVLSLGACGGDSLPAAQNGYVGTVDGTDAYVAIVVADKTVAAYVCDGPNQVAESFWTTVSDPGSFTLDTPSGAVLRAQIVGDVATGQVTLRSGATHTFSAQVARGDAGLYYTLQDSALDPELWAGWVLDNNGSQRGAIKLRSQFQPTPSLSSSGVVIGGTGFAVARIGSIGGRVYATRIVAPSTYVLPPIIVTQPAPPAPGVPIPYPN